MCICINEQTYNHQELGTITITKRANCWYRDVQAQDLATHVLAYPRVVNFNGSLSCLVFHSIFIYICIIYFVPTRQIFTVKKLFYISYCNKFIKMLKENFYIYLGALFGVTIFFFLFY